MEECERQNVKEPMWSQEGHYVMIKFSRENTMSVEQQTSAPHDADNKTGIKTDSNDKNGQQNGRKTDSKGEISGQQRDKKSKTEELRRAILNLLLDGEKSIVELMAISHYKKRESFRKSILNDMLEYGWVVMKHPENPSHKNQRYIITDKGRKEI